MRYITLVFSFFLLLQNLIANNPGPSISVPSSLSQCSPVNLDISGGTPPYSVSTFKADDPNGRALQQFTDVNRSSNLSLSSDLHWATAITFQVKDSQGLIATSGPCSVTVSPKCQGPTQPQTSSAPTATNETSQFSNSSTESNTTAVTNSTAVSSSTVLLNSTQNSALGAGPTNSTDARLTAPSPGSSTQAEESPVSANSTSSISSSKNSSQSQDPGSVVGTSRARESTKSTPANRHAATSTSSKHSLTSLRLTLFVILVVIGSTLV